ncbi:MAG TPA: hypothetical protein VGP47_11115 [Parachlamydiaceae bacterium]|nr:hypothetical protein [Parachlamydiaceae bacterium]
MKHNKNRTKTFGDHVELVFEEEMHELADAITESAQKTSSFCDPFEDYVEVVRSKIHSNPHIFRSRLVKGYSALLHALQDNENRENHPN